MLIQTTTHQLGTTHQAQRDVSPTCFYQGFPGSWQFFLEGCRVSHHGLNHKHLINTELFSKYGDKLLVMKSLLNILKFAYFNIVFYSFFFFFFFVDIGLINNLKTFNGHALMLVGTFIDMLVWRSDGSVQDHIKVYRNCIKVSVRLYKSVQDYSNLNLHSYNTPFWLK